MKLGSSKMETEDISQHFLGNADSLTKALKMLVSNENALSFTRNKSSLSNETDFHYFLYCGDKIIL